MAKQRTNVGIRKILAGASASLAGIFLLFAGSSAINTILEGYRADSNTTTTIDATPIGGDCRKVTTSNDGVNRFIPTKTLVEWNAFKAAAPGMGISLNSCVYVVGKSLLFDSSQSQYLSRTFGTPTDGRKWTFSFWVKRSQLYTSNNIQFILATQGAGAQGVVGFGHSNNGDELGFAYGGYHRKYTKMLFRDPAAWSHVVLKFDSTLPAEADRAVFYVDGTLAETVTNTTVSLNDTTQINQAVQTLIGNQTWQPYGRLDGYLSDVHFVDGQALAASAFGQTDAETGRWKPAAYAGTHGANGFHLAFNNDLSIGEDSAPIDANHTAANHWAPNNFLLANGTITSNGTWTVPAGITSLTASAWGSGGGGGAGGSYGGGGGFARATINVTPGETLEMRVGSVGTNGAGIGGGSAGNGWGYTGVFRGAPSQANALVIAGGGGGGGPVVSGVHDGGGGGGTSGQTGQGGSAGLGGTQSAGGSNGGSNGSPTDGSALAGGGGGAPEGYYGGAGGWAGYYGWGGGAQGQTLGGGSGGGGSGYGTGSNVSLVAASSYVAANNADALYQPGYGNGGQPGLIQLSYGAQAPSLTLDSPTNNFATMNPLDWGGWNPTFSRGNLKITGVSATHQYTRATMAFPKAGKWYWEAQTNTTASSMSVHALWIATTTGLPNTATKQSTIYLNNYGQVSNQNSLMFAVGGNVPMQTYGASYVQSAGDILRFAFDADTNKYWIGVNGNWFDSTGNYTGNPSTGVNPTETLSAGHEWTPITEPFNAQSETFFFGAGGQGNLTYYPDAGGNFRYAPPTGFKALSTANLPSPEIANPKLHFDVLTWAGNGSYLSPVGNLASNPSPGYDVAKSLLFNRNQSQYLNRTFGTPTDNKKWTWSGWVKRGKLGVQQGIFVGMETGNTYSDITFQSTDKIRVYQQTSWADVFYSETKMAFRNPSEWHHLTVAYDSAQAVAADRIKFHVDGVPASMNTTTPVPLNQLTSVNKNSVGHTVGIIPTNPATYLDGYLSDVHFVDGQALSPTDFGQTDSVTGKWAPKAYAGTYGANGFRLNFGNSSSIGEDSAPLGGSHPAANTWTPNNFWNVSTKTFLVDDGTKAGNVTYSARIVWAGTVNLTAFGGAGNISGSVFTGISALNGLISDWQPSTVKKNGVTLFSVTGGSVTNDSSAQTASQSRNADTVTQNGVAVADGDIITFEVGANAAVTQYYGYPNSAPSLSITTAGGALIAADNAITIDSPTNNFAVLNPLDQQSGEATSSFSYGNLNWSATNSANGQYFGRSTIPISSWKWYFETRVTIVGDMNDSFAIWIRTSDGQVRAMANRAVDIGYYGTGAYELVQNRNPPWVAGDVVGVAVDTAAETITFTLNGSPFVTKTAQGLSGKVWRPYVTDGLTNSRPAFAASMNFGQLNQVGYSYYAGAGGYFKYAPPAGFKALSSKNLPEPTTFDPGLVWIKNRSAATNHVLFDSNRGATLGLSSNDTNAEASYPNGLLSFNNGGFSLGSDSTVNASGNNYVAWNWKAGEIPVANTDGTIPSQVSANRKAGVSIATYIGSAANATIWHGLGNIPKMIMVKSRDSAVSTNWAIYHADSNASPQNYYLYMNSTAAALPGSTIWNNSAPTTSTFSVWTAQNTNDLWKNHVAYAFSEVPGFSKFGKYTGNGSADGTFVYTGFKPKFILTKRIDGGVEHWNMFDGSRIGYNPANYLLYSNRTDGDDTVLNRIDLLSNGFKARDNGSGYNSTNAIYIYAAFADTGMSPVLAPNTAPNAPTFVSATATNPTTLSATYSDPDLGDSGWTNYRLATSAAGCLDNSATVAWGTVAAANNSSAPWTSPSMAGATYYWCAQNDDGAAKSAWAGMGTVVMPAGYPGCDTPDITLANGQIWAACNVGATVAYAGQGYPADTAPTAGQKAYMGGYFQWGRNDDVTAGSSTTTLAPTGTLAGGVGHSNFIIRSSVFDWIDTPDGNLWGGGSTSVGAGTFTSQVVGDQAIMKGPCATGYHVPTQAEWWSAVSTITPTLTNTTSWQNDTAVRTTLKLPLAGFRDSSSAVSYGTQGSYGYYLTSSPTGLIDSYWYYSYYVIFTNSNMSPVEYGLRSDGVSVRCLKNPTTASFTFNQTISSNTLNYNLKTAAIAAGWNQVDKLYATVTVNSGIYVWSNSTAIAAFDTDTLPSGSTFTLINNGYIMGRGGDGGGYGRAANGDAGGNAMNITLPATITSTAGHILGGGGGGGGSSIVGGGGGAGGGKGGNASATIIGSVGGIVGVASVAPGYSENYALAAGAGGGRIPLGTAPLPVPYSTHGTTFDIYPIGSQAGGNGGISCPNPDLNSVVTAGAGGAYNTVGNAGWSSDDNLVAQNGGGGGGYGLAGGDNSFSYPDGYTFGTISTGGAGGKAIKTNGNAVTWTNGSQPANVRGAVN